MALLETSIVYCGLFAAVYVLLVAEERTRNPWGRFGFLAGAVLLPALLSGFRATSVGTDTAMYVDCIRNWIASGTWTEQSERFERGFKWLVMLFTGYSHAPAVVLTCFYALMYGIALAAFDRVRSVAPPRLSYVFYLLVCMIPSWNALRQTLACSFVMLGFSYLMTGGTLRGLAALAATVLFHKSSVVCFAALPLAFVSRTTVRTYLGAVAAFSLFGIALVVACVPEYGYYVREFTGGTRHAFFKHLITCGALAAVLFAAMPKDGLRVRLFCWYRPLAHFLGQVILFALALQLFHFSMDWADRLLQTFSPVIAFACAYAFVRGTIAARLVAFAYVVPYSFVYHYLICNQHECNAFAFAF